MPAEPPQYHQQHTRQRRRRRRPLVASCGQLIFLAVVGGVGTTSAFVPPPQALRHSSVPHTSAAASQQQQQSATGGAAARRRRSRMVLADSPSEACRRALQRAWEASPEETPQVCAIIVVRRCPRGANARNCRRGDSSLYSVASTFVFYKALTKLECGVLIYTNCKQSRHVQVARSPLFTFAFARHEAHRHTRLPLG